MAMKRLLLVDVNPLLYRTAFGSQGTVLSVLKNGKEVKTTVLNGICHNILTALEETTPTHVCLAKDWRWTCDLERYKKYPMYKASRARKPLKESKPDLYEEIMDCWEVLPGLLEESFGAQTIESAGHEADDVIGTLATQAKKKGFEVVILSNDNDFVQLLDDGVKILTHNKDNPNFEERTHKSPGSRFQDIKLDQFLDFRALAGDQVDGIPGCSGIGPKRASQLLKEYGDLETILQEAPNMKKSKMRENLIYEKDNIWLYRELVELKQDVDELKSLTDLPPICSAENGSEEAIKKRREAFAKAPKKSLADLELPPRSKRSASVPFETYALDVLIKRIETSEIFSDDLVA